jgi:predicted enzyme related to lactoylglutathione lyase
MLHVADAADAAGAMLIGLVEGLRRGWARGAERLGNKDSRPAAIVCVVVGAAIIWGALPRTSSLDVTAMGASIILRHFWPIVGTALILAVAPTRWHYPLQSAALGALLVTYELEEEGPIAPKIVTLAMWATSTLLVWRLPLKNGFLRKSLIVLVTASLPLLARRLNFEQGVVIIQFLFACEVMARQECRSWLRCQRAVSSPLTMMPPTDLIATDRSGGSILLGAVFVAGGLLGLRALDRAGPCGSFPFFFCAQSLALRVADEVWVHPRPASLAWAAVRDVAWIASFALQYSVFVGILNFLGVPMRFITGNMLRVRNLFDYWKTANRWQYELLRTVYLDNFFSIGRGWTAASGIVLVFVVSGLLHLPGRLPSTGSLASIVVASEIRWVIFGVLCAASYQIRAYSVRRRLRASLGGARGVDSSTAFAKLVAASSLFAVLAVSGLLITWDEVFGTSRPYWVVSCEGPEGVRKRQFYESLDYGGPTRPAEKIAGATTAASPAIASLDDALYAAWRDEGSPSLQWAKLAGAAWTRSRPIAGAASDASPALASLGPRVFAAWKGVGPEASIHWRSLDDGPASRSGQIEGTRASGAPALASWGGRLYATWTGANPDDPLLWASFDGGLWTYPARVAADARGTAPALTTVDDRLYAVWRGSGKLDRTLWWTRFDGSEWAPLRQVPGVETSSGPAVASLDHRLEVGWRGVGLDPDIQWISFDGAWARPARTGLSTCDRPSMASHDGYLVFAWRGKEATRCDAPSDYGGAWDLTSVYFVDVPRASSDPGESTGRIVWRNLRTSDPIAAAAFYSEVIGWRTASTAGTHLTLAGPRGVFGNISRISDEDRRRGVLPYWAPTVAVTDVDATVQRVTSAGGRVYVEPNGAPGVRFAVIGDPGGAALDVTSLVGDATLHDSSEPGDFHGGLLTTSDGDAEVRFYGDIFGWRRTKESGETAVTLARGRTEICTLSVVPSEPVSSWLLYVEVSDLDAAIRRAVSGGGSVGRAPVPVPDGGRVVELVDPQGAHFGLHEAARTRGAAP